MRFNIGKRPSLQYLNTSIFFSAYAQLPLPPLAAQQRSTPVNIPERPKRGRGSRLIAMLQALARRLRRTLRLR